MAKEKKKKKVEIEEEVKELSVAEPDAGELKESSAELPVEITPDEIVDNSGAEVEIGLEDPEFTPEPADPKKRNSGRVLVILGIIVVLLAVAATIFYDVGGKEKIVSPLTIHGKAISSSDFSFMYHFTMIEEGIDLFAADTPSLLASPYEDDENYSSYRNYFLDLAAQEMQTVEILYDDAKSKGLDIENKHYERAEAYISWLRSKADQLGVSLDTYIKGVYGSQVSEQTILNYLAKKFFTEDYSEGAKLEELSATEEQAQEAFEADRNSYEFVDYKILRITYEQREQPYVETANLRAQQIIDDMEGDPSKFESVAAKYFAGSASAALASTDSTLVANCRFGDFTHSDFRSWLFGVDRRPGDATIFSDEDGFPIILVFVKREKLASHLRDVHIAHITTKTDDEGNKNISTSQTLAQKIYEYITDADSFSEIENLYNTEVLEGTLIVTHSQMTFREQYTEQLSDWIFDSARAPGNKTIIEIDGDFYILYFEAESPNQEWYDRVNSFIRMNNYKEFMDQAEAEYTYTFDEVGLSYIRDVP